MLFVPPLIDHRTLITSTTRLVVAKIWSYEPASNKKFNCTPTNPVTPQAPSATLPKRPTTKDRTPQSKGEETSKKPTPAEGCKGASQPLPYAPPDVASPPSLL